MDCVSAGSYLFCDVLLNAIGSPQVAVYSERCLRHVARMARSEATRRSRSIRVRCRTRPGRAYNITNIRRLLKLSSAFFFDYLVVNFLFGLILRISWLLISF